MISIVLKKLEKKQDVLLLQESTISKDKAISRWGLSDKYRQQPDERIRLGIDITLPTKHMDSLSIVKML